MAFIIQGEYKVYRDMGVGLFDSGSPPIWKYHLDNCLATP